MYTDLRYAEIWVVDFEYYGGPGERPNPICLVAWELRTGRKIKLWYSEFKSSPPYRTDAGVLFVAYAASAEISCHLVLGWPVPERVLDLYVEFRDRRNGAPTPAGSGLLGALAAFDIPGITALEKKEMRDLVLTGGPWTHDQRAAILNYCETDVAALAQLLPKMLPQIQRPYALLRGRYMSAVARMEHTGVPIDVELLHQLRANWDPLKDRLIGEVDADYGIYDGRTFKVAKFETFLRKNDISWPRLPSGQLDLKDDTFREMARIHPEIAPIYELRATLSQMKLHDLAVGGDGRNRCSLRAFGAVTGRNTPSNSEFVYGPAVWLRALIQPPPGYGLAYLDFEQQEFAIAAVYSRDPAMLEAYESGDPYMAFAILAGAAPADATKATHKAIRDQYKGCILATQYGMGPHSFASRINRPLPYARELLRHHHETFNVFWKWSDRVVNHFVQTGRIHTVFGWRRRLSQQLNVRSVRNFPMQSGGAEMLRLAGCLATERGIEVCAPVHDALLIAAPLQRLDEDIARMQAVMRAASRAVLGGFEVRVEATAVRHPDRFIDPRGEVMWRRIMSLLEKIDGRLRAAA